MTTANETEPVFMEYTVDREEAAMRQRLGVFANACGEHNLMTEVPIEGVVIVDVPLGKEEESLPVIMANAKTAGIQMWKYDDE